MDTSPEYIEMCEKSEEIQKIKFPKFVDGDYIWNYKRNKFGIFSSTATEHFDPDYEKTNNEVWLPRQDQLQEIILNNSKSGWNVHQLSMCFEDFRGKWLTMEVGKTDRLPNGHFNTMEKIWFHFLMAKVYKKYWYCGGWYDLTVYGINEWYGKKSII